ncbi:hypothetical protein LTR70_001828 [Exophiala xenobiotica]|uniref:Uncharacterized protein n=1 Tax=Lithohypha guttulata TaxID=1690604 RepID=A0ABR0KMX5_9EURO|nr:hypothetical protein LTR24_000978 [Lithohypha guttulata]KAK5327086.1 hypothetical protein LTR70_001828 [Exophiala xenobiotica]
MPLGYIFSGWSQERGDLLHHWKKWQAEAGLRQSGVRAEACVDAIDYINNRVKAWSKEWKNKGWWKVTGTEFCSYCGLPDIKDLSENVGIEFQSALIDAAAQDDWDGNFTQVRARSSPDF